MANLPFYPLVNTLRSRDRLHPVPAAGRGLIALAAVVVAIVSYRYVFDMPPIPLNIAGNRHRATWLVIHAGFAATALLTGWLQFNRKMRLRRPSLHRRAGRLYAVSCLVGAVAGLILAAGTTAGPIATVGFGSLAVVWFYTTAVGWQRACSGQLAAHRRWMIRSWALTLSAVTLRLYLPFADLIGVPDLAAYRAISFLCWMPNLALAEMLLSHRWAGYVSGASR